MNVEVRMVNSKEWHNHPWEDQTPNQQKSAESRFPETKKGHEKAQRAEILAAHYHDSLSACFKDPESLMIEAEKNPEDEDYFVN